VIPWAAMADIVKVLLSRYPLVILLLGVIAFLIGASGTVPLHYATVRIAETGWRVATAALGLGLLGLSIALARSERGVKIGHDVFLAYPMAALQRDAYAAGRAEALDIVEALKTHANVNTVYFAGQKIDSPERFEAQDVAAEVDLKAIDAARYFVMVLPDKIVSSVLFEAGYALARKKPSVYFVRSTDHLPYVMTHVDTLPQKGFPRVRIRTYADRADLVRLIKSDKEHLFPVADKAA
jgi:hypothetical protein